LSNKEIFSHLKESNNIFFLSLINEEFQMCSKIFNETVECVVNELVSQRNLDFSNLIKIQNILNYFKLIDLNKFEQ
jgi:hypothetical protein